MAQTELNVTARDVVGKGGAHSLRRQGLIPAVVYGKGMETCTVVVAPKALQAAIATEAGWNTLITLKGDGAFDGKVVILKDMQVEPIRREVQHVDFQTIDLQKKVHVMVPVHPVGKSEGEKNGGLLQVIRHELELVCLPSAIPSAIEVDVTALGIGDVLHINDLVLPAGVEAPHDVNFTVITVTGHKAEEAAEGEEAVEA
ncbi:MAG TPA: 50S ribosomal protein L25/general stress protein Ctc [Desulfuromonadales bacterium]|jgi:large subunit ribosomal protein L25